jgi:cellulose synthase/poly-beta-1,6-N-acetylglucosamine synthase-like glycosyltransferase
MTGFVARGARSSLQYSPMISFIVPAYNEELELSSTIAAIRAAAAASHATQPHEIIVVDDASADATAKIAERAGARVISINRRQIAAARNAGARAANGQYLFFVDATRESARRTLSRGSPFWKPVMRAAAHAP